MNLFWLDDYERLEGYLQTAVYDTPGSSSSEIQSSFTDSATSWHFLTGVPMTKCADTLFLPFGEKKGWLKLEVHTCPARGTHCIVNVLWETSSKCCFRGLCDWQRHFANKWRTPKLIQWDYCVSEARLAITKDSTKITQHSPAKNNGIGYVAENATSSIHLGPSRADFWWNGIITIWLYLVIVLQNYAL